MSESPRTELVCRVCDPAGRPRTTDDVVSDGHCARCGAPLDVGFAREHLPRDATHRIVSGEHAIVAGQVWAMAMRHGLDLTPVLDEDGRYSAELELVLPTDVGVGVEHIRIVVSPPELDEPSS
jgi:hypothetical protein